MHGPSRKQVPPQCRNRHLGTSRIQSEGRARVRMHAHRAHPQEARLMQPRSWLFVPADNERNIAKALESDADALIFDLEDSVAPANKAKAREMLKELPKGSSGPQLWVRVNPIGSEFHKDDLRIIRVAE